MWTIGRSAARNASASAHIAASASEVPAISNGPPSSTSRWVSIVISAAEEKSGSVKGSLTPFSHHSGGCSPS